MRILLVDDHPMVREGLRSILELEDDMAVVGEASDGREAVELVGSANPDAVVMDISMPGLGGIEATRQLLAVCKTCRVVALSMNTDAHFVRSMFDAGASAYLPKTAGGQELILALRSVQSGAKYVSPALAGVLIDGMLHGAPDGERQRVMGLTPRESEVLQLLAEGKTSKEIAATLDIATTTVETFRRKIMEKLEIRTVAELTKFAIRHGLTSIE